MPRWRYIGRVRRDARLRSIVRRGLWAVRMAGMRAADIKRIRFRFWTELHWGDIPCYGSCEAKDDKTLIDVTVGRCLEETLCHELAHAAHVQGRFDAEGERHDDHDPVWKAWRREIRRYYFSDERGPAVVE